MYPNELKFHKSVDTVSTGANIVKPCHPDCECTEEDGCPRFYTRTSCPPSCKNCHNEFFHSTKNHARVVKEETGSKGSGLFAGQTINDEDFVIAFIAEVISKSEEQRRRVEYAKDGKHAYFFGSSQYTNDATTYGNQAKFVNHSCNPNMVAKTWSVHGAPQNYRAVGFVACRRIEDGEELTINYGEDYSKTMECRCGAKNCAGIVGQKTTDVAKKPKVASFALSAPVVRTVPAKRRLAPPTEEISAPIAVAVKETAPTTPPPKRVRKAPTKFADQFENYYLKKSSF